MEMKIAFYHKPYIINYILYFVFSIYRCVNLYYKCCNVFLGGHFEIDK